MGGVSNFGFKGLVTAGVADLVTVLLSVLLALVMAVVVCISILLEGWSGGIGYCEIYGGRGSSGDSGCADVNSDTSYGNGG